MARLAVAFNDDLHRKAHLNETERLGEAEVIGTATEIAELLGADLVPVRDDLSAALRTLQRYDIVVNLCEGVLGNPRFELNFALALEMLGIAFTGCDPLATALCIDKVRAKRLLAAAGVPVPRSGVLPAIVKPSREDAGIGIDASSIVTTAEARDAKIREIEATYRQPALVEEFIDGRELNQAMVLGDPLPPGEVLFASDLAPHERIVGWKAKWAAGSREDLATVNRTPADVDDATRDRIAAICRKAERTLGIGGYCRFDLRQAPTGELFIVDVNPNPDIGRDTGFRKALDAAGITFSDFLGTLIMAARLRRRS
ncbi:MAG: D-alanine--D-alanine ligase [Acidobacteria bacterium]|nr:D-alanine--D-alanine ligase [Acidobacteriota bacterium]